MSEEPKSKSMEKLSPSLYREVREITFSLGVIIDDAAIAVVDYAREHNCDVRTTFAEVTLYVGPYNTPEEIIEQYEQKQKIRENEVALRVLE